MRRAGAVAVLLMAGPVLAANGADTATAFAGLAIEGDAIPRPLSGRVGDPARGAAVAVDRRLGNCLACHRMPVDEPFQGEVGPDLADIGGRLDPGQIRLRVADASRIWPGTLMPPYYRVDGLTDVAEEYRGRPALSAQQMEDVVAFLASLEEAP